MATTPPWNGVPDLEARRIGDGCVAMLTEAFGFGGEPLFALVGLSPVVSKKRDAGPSRSAWRHPGSSSEAGATVAKGWVDADRDLAGLRRSDRDGSVSASDGYRENWRARSPSWATVASSADDVASVSAALACRARRFAPADAANRPSNAISRPSAAPPTARAVGQETASVTMNVGSFGNPSHDKTKITVSHKSPAAITPATSH